MNLKQKIGVWSAFGVLIMAGLLVILFFFWAFYPYHIIDFELPITVKNENREVIRGDKLYLETSYNKHIAVNGHGTSYIICEDGNLVTVLPPRSVGVMFPLGEHTFEFDMIVPEKTSLGTCHFESIIEYEINPIRNVPVEIYTEDFEVIE